MVKIRVQKKESDWVVYSIPSSANPYDVLGELLGGNLMYQVDYTDATKAEIIAWGGADMMVRVLRASQRGLDVSFMGTCYGQDELQRLEDDIVASGYCVRVESDDHNGVVIGIVQPE